MATTLEARAWFDSLSQDERDKITMDYNIESYGEVFKYKMLAGTEIREVYELHLKKKE